MSEGEATPPLTGSTGSGSRLLVENVNDPHPHLVSPPSSPSSEGAAMASGSSEVTAATQEPAEAAEECSGKDAQRTS